MLDNLSPEEQEAAEFYFEFTMRQKMGLELSMSKAHLYEHQIKDKLPENRRAEIEKTMNIITSRALDTIDALLSKAEVYANQQLKNIDYRLTILCEAKQKAILNDLKTKSIIRKSDLDKAIQKHLSSSKIQGGVV
ncbi:MAG: hypothetical protein NWF00_06685 [Candidatus Bathyarchaeota archaeon]|nr:hypothetical protein [Candidatus Bathyarchaeota archaeon]